MKPLKKIMYVEDDPDIRQIVEISLEKIGGFQVTTCGSGKEALQLAQEFFPDLVLLDIMMPDMDGPSVLINLHNIPELTSIPAIFITAKTRKNEINCLKEQKGVLGVITKPFDPITLPEILKKLWEESND